MNRTVALYDYAADPADPEQLSVHAGEELSMGEDAGSGWIFVTNSSGKVGIVPASYLGPVEATSAPAAPAITESPEEAVIAAPPAATVMAVTESTSASEPQQTEVAESETPTQQSSDPKYAKYERMRKAGLPQGAILNAMQRDKVDPGNFFGTSSESGGDSVNAEGASSAETYDPAIEKYKRMEKAGLPEGAIRNAMARDGVDASLMYGGSAQPTPPRPSPVASGAPGASGGDSLAEQLKMKKLNATPTTPPKQVVASTGPSPSAAAKSETSPFDEVKKRALERQKRLEASGGLLTEEKGGSSGGAQHSPPDKSQWKPNLKKSEGQNQPRPAETSNKPDWRANLHKVPEKPAPADDPSKKRSQEDADVAIEVKAAPQAEKSAEPCSHYQVNTAAAQFEECRCGHPKSAHGAVKKSDDSASAKEVQRASSSNEHRETPCDSYRLDTTAARFGDCKCGHPKADHGKSKPSAVGASPSSTGPVVSKTQTPEKAPQPCGNYRLNVTAQTFGDCVCGHSKSAHVTTPKGASSSPSITATTTTSLQTEVEKSEKPCSTFRVDKKGQFGMCVCGHSKADHEDKPKATPPRALSSPSSASSKEKQSPSGPKPEPCSTFKVNVSASGFGICVCGHPRSEHGKPQRHKSDPNESRAETGLQFDEAKPTKKAALPCDSFSLDMKADRFGVCKCGFTKADHGAKRKASLAAAASLSAAAKLDDADDWIDGQDSNAQSTESSKANEIKGAQVSGEASQPTSVTSVLEQARGEDTQEASPKPNKAGENTAVLQLQPHVSNEMAPAGEPSQVGSPQRAAPLPPGPGSPRRAAPPPPTPSSTVASGGVQDTLAATSNQPRRSAPPPPADAGMTQASNEAPAQSSPLNQPRRNAPPPPAEASSGIASSPRAMRAAPPPPTASSTTGGAAMRAPPPPPAGVGAAAIPTTSAAAPPRAPPPPPGVAATAPQQGYAPYVAANPGVQPALGGPTHFRQAPPPPNVQDANRYIPPAIPQAGEIQQGHFAGNIPYAQAVPQQSQAFQQMGQPMMQQPPAQQQAPAGRKWPCSRCTFENESQAVACLICDLPRADLPQQPRPAPQQQLNAPYPVQSAQSVTNRQPMIPPAGMRVMREWNCAACTYLNPPLNLKCEICGSSRPAESQRPPVQQQQQQPPSSSNPFQSFW